MKEHKKWFTMVELVVVITILTILATISFISYQEYIISARNAARASDMSNIKMSLKNHKLKNSLYPLPWNAFDITNSVTIIKQWFLNENVNTQEIIQKPKDPQIKDQYYFYSITSNRLFYQIGMTLEEEGDWQWWSFAYIDWDYQQIAQFVPSLVFASASSGTINSLSWSFIVDKSTLNLPYDIDGSIKKTATSFTNIINESWINIPKFYWYMTCQEIYENGGSMWSWIYNILDNDWNATQTGCVMNY